MERDLVRVREFYAGWKTEDLKRIVAVDKADYEPWAINIIEGIRISRITPEKIETFRSDSKMDDSGFHEKNRRTIALDCERRGKSINLKEPQRITRKMHPPGRMGRGIGQ